MPNGKREQISSFHHGAITNALSQVTDVQATDRDRQVVTFNGDGGLSMLLSGLVTVKQEQLPIEMFVLNNPSLGMVRLEVLVQGLPRYQTDHGAIGYTGAAGSLGIKTIQVGDPAGTPRLTQEALTYDGPVPVGMVTDPNALFTPASITQDMLMGFSKAAARTVFDGDVGQTINMVRSNLRSIPRP